ncbi:MAG: Thiol-disulfide oxidoreductase YkuV [Planctomycetota bacterium]|jgi:thiol-disulfide isomerase/thioredoxin/sugar lactone lactonase YvrE
MTRISQLLLFCVSIVLTQGIPATAMAVQTETAPATAGADEAAAQPPENPFPKAVKIPPGILDGGSEWMNTSRPIDLAELKGKVVLLDFWTYCCINCMHVLPDLKYLEEKYGDQLVVIGVHSAKFDNEKDSANIRDAILRYEIQHPVVNDSEMLIWRKFGTRAWPTVALIDPEGNYCGSQSGEGHRELLDSVIGQLIKYHRSRGTLNETPIVFDRESAKVQATPLRYPGKVLADPAGQRLFITDSNHNRIVVTSLSGELKSVIGSGRSGRRDGSFQEAEFQRPQGTALVGNLLYVADTENHLIRRIDLDAGTVSTLAGTGEQGQPGVPATGRLLETSLNSPWSIAAVNGTLYIAMAGPHQIWSHSIGSDSIGAFAGSGREDVINGPLATAAFAQPSEIITDSAGQYLYLVDSEGSSIRRVPVDPAGEVSTLAGTSELPRGQSLFAFGDLDGIGAEARFQHPLGIALFQDQLYIADSYNHKIRQLTLASNAVSTWLGDGKPGRGLDPVQLNEPGGLSIAQDRLWIADTNNHRILTVNLTDRSTAVLDIPGLAPPAAVATVSRPDLSKAVELPEQKLAVSPAVQFAVQLSIPEGNKRNDLFPVTWSVFSEGEPSLLANNASGVRTEAQVTDGNVAEFSVPLTGQPGSCTVILQVSYGYCAADGTGLCRLATGTWKIPVVLNTDGGESRISITFPEPPTM